MSPYGIGLLGLVSIVSLIFTLLKGEHKTLTTKGEIGPNLINFFLMMSLTLTILVCYVVSKKHLLATEFVTPVFVLCFALCATPLYYDSLKEPTIIANQSMAQMLNVSYISMMILGQFFDGNYIISMISRSICFCIVLMIGIRRKLAGDAAFGPILFNFISVVLLIELSAYNTNHK